MANDGSRLHLPLISMLVASGITLAGLPGSTSPPEAAEANGSTESTESNKSGKTRDLSGIWQTQVTGSLVGQSLLCQAVPKLNHSQVDTVLKARTLKELFYAVIPDSSLRWFESVCEPEFNGDRVTGTCRIPLDYARPCGLVADMNINGRLNDAATFTGEGKGVVTTGGPGLCPKATCPGEIQVVARRIGGVPESRRITRR